jgi:outer membrane protein TolC
VAAAEAYVRLAQAREQAALLEASRETLTRHVEMARVYAGQGMIVRSELLRAEVELARLDDLLAEARGQARLAETDLSFRLGADLAAVWTLEPLPAEVSDPGTLEVWLAQAGARSDLAAMRHMVAAGQLEEEVQRAAARPRVGLVVRHDLYDSLPIGAHGDSTTVMAMAGVDLWNGGRHRAAAAAARSEADAVSREVERMERGIRLEVQQAWQAMDTARSRQRTAVRSLEAAREAERILGERFRSGVSRMIDLLDAATARREAETRELVARAESQAAAFRLTFAAGKPPESALSPEAPKEGAAR